MLIPHFCRVKDFNTWGPKIEGFEIDPPETQGWFCLFNMAINSRLAAADSIFHGPSLVFRFTDSFLITQATMVHFVRACQFVFLCCDTTPWPEAAWGGKKLFGLYILILVHHRAKPGRKLKQAQRHEPCEGTQLTGLPTWLSQCASYTTMVPLSRAGTTNSGLGPPTFTINEENVPCRSASSSGGVIF